MSLEPPPAALKGLERLLSVQRPLVVAHVRSIRRAHPDATPAQVIRILERRYLTAVTSGGAAVGASAVIPGVGTGVSLALSGVETAGFLEASALFAQSVTEVHGIAVDDPERARTLVMAMMLGTGGSDLVRQLVAEMSGGGASRSGFWGEMVTKNLPKAAMGRIASRIRRSFVRRFLARQGGSALGRVVPFGIGAVVGGAGNNMLGRKVIASSRDAFGVPPAVFPLELEPREGRGDGPRRLPRLPWRRAIEAPDAPGTTETPAQTGAPDGTGTGAPGDDLAAADRG